MDTSQNNNSTNIEQIKKIFFWRTAFFGLIILVAGIVIGGASMSIMVTHKYAAPTASPRYDNLMPRLRQILGLTQQQITKINPILVEHMQKLYTIREDARVDIISTLDQMNQEITPILAERQKIVWQQELIRIERELSPEPIRGGGGARRRGTEQPRQGQGQGQGARRYGSRAQQSPRPEVNEPLIRPELQPIPDGPNFFPNEVIQ